MNSMEGTTEENSFNRPFPALTAAQRWHLEVNGYVVIENVLDGEQVACILEALQKLKAQFMAASDPWNTKICNCHMFGQGLLGEHSHFNHLLEADSIFLDYAANPRIVGMAEEVVGGTVRVTETQAAINRRKPGERYDGPGRYNWHRHRPQMITYIDRGLFHCTFVKGITNLTELGSDDGGTVVIAGSHKVGCPEEGIVRAAREDPSLIHRVVAPAGSTLFFCESLLHATGDVRSDKERAIIVTGYMPWNHRSGTGIEISEGFAEKVPESLHKLIFGSDLNTRLRRRTLDMTVGTADPGEYISGWSVTSTDPQSYQANDLTAPQRMRES